jgi:hypothetical protein
MTTQAPVLRTAEEFNRTYVPIYKAIFPLFINEKAQQYAAEVGKLNFNTVEAVGDLDAKEITPKDSDIQTVSVVEGLKAFRKYFLARKYRNSSLQDASRIDLVISQVLDHNLKLQDKLLLLGGGTTPSNVLNNGLFLSGDPNFTLEGETAEIAVSGDLPDLADFCRKVMATADKADQVAGRKLIIFYGEEVIPSFTSLFDTGVRSVRGALQETLGAEYSMAKLPQAVTPDGESGWIIANLDQCKLHYTELPKLLAQGVNEEDLYTWHNVIMGSMMLEVLAKDGIIRQPAELESE